MKDVVAAIWGVVIIAVLAFTAGRLYARSHPYQEAKMAIRAASDGEITGMDEVCNSIDILINQFDR